MLNITEISPNKTTSNKISEESSIRSLSSEDVSQAPQKYCCAKSANPAAGKGRKLHLMQMLILPFIPILALIIETSLMLNDVIIYRQEVLDIESQVTIATELGKVVTRMQLERSEVAFYVYTNGSTQRSHLEQRFELTNAALLNMSSWPNVSLQLENGKSVSLDQNTFLEKLKNFRQVLTSAFYGSEFRALPAIRWVKVEGRLLNNVSRVISSKILIEDEDNEPVFMKRLRGEKYFGWEY